MSKTTVVVPPHVRRTRNGGVRPVSGYRAQRERVLRMLAQRERGLPLPMCGVEGCPAPENELQIAHLGPDQFTGSGSREGGAAYSRWMQHVQQHPENYAVRCTRHHGEMDCRTLVPPFVTRLPKHLRKQRYAEFKAGVST